MKEGPLRRSVTRLMPKSSVYLALAAVLACSFMASGSGEDTTWESEGGHLVLMEQYTATWCESCSSVDEMVSEFTRENSGRLVRVAIHDHVADPLGTPITAHRIQLHPPAPVTPTFWMDGEMLGGGLPDKAMLSQELLSSESSRSDDSRMRLNLEKVTNSELSITLSITAAELDGESKASIFAILDSVSLNESEAENGLTEHHDVVFAYAESPVNGSDGWQYPEEVWSPMESAGHDDFPSSPIVIRTNLTIPDGVELSNLRLVAVHERANQNGEITMTKGVVELFIGEGEKEAGTPLAAPIAAILAISTIALTSQSRR